MSSTSGNFLSYKTVFFDLGVSICVTNARFIREFYGLNFTLHKRHTCRSAYRNYKPRSFVSKKQVEHLQGVTSF